LARREGKGGGFRIGEMPCEYAAREIIPSIRAAIALVMIERGLSKYKAASILGMTPAAITNYTSGKRGGRFVPLILTSPEFRSIVERVGEVLLSDADEKRKEAVFRSAICAICSKLNKYECEAPYAASGAHWLGDGVKSSVRAGARNAQRPS
jgi:predicted transcriptional regulator